MSRTKQAAVASAPASMSASADGNAMARKPAAFKSLSMAWFIPASSSTTTMFFLGSCIQCRFMGRGIVAAWFALLLELGFMVSGKASECELSFGAEKIALWCDRVLITLLLGHLALAQAANQAFAQFRWRRLRHGLAAPLVRE